MESPQPPSLWSFLIFLAVPQILAAQGTCSRGACYPPVGDLLVGRIHHLKASSTCGLVQAETYCTPYGEWQMKCCRCDSRVPHTYNSHRVDNVLSSRGHLRWWQSQNNVNPVSLQLDLDGKFQLSSILLDFRSPLPAGMLIERSTDFGKTWRIYQYLASDCAASFPRVPRGSPERWHDVRCQELRAQHRHPQRGGKVEFNPIALGSGITTSHSQSINHLGEFTSLRINFTELPRLPHHGYRASSSFYAVTEMKVQGSCFCHGHADRCAPSSPPSGDTSAAVKVHGHCMCQHNTAGPHCNRCAAFYNDQPWRPADDRSPNECRKCDCNGHSETCHFDPAVYQASGGVSGGVCDNCQHHTEGRSCERCKTNFFRNRRQDLAHPEACLPCECDPDGTVPGSICDALTGRCVCKENVQGDRCHLCKPGFTQLANANPQGCRKCTCNLLGTRQDQPCDDETGRCFCLPNVVGANCDQCSANHWKIAGGQGCQPCRCDPRNSLSPQCNQFTGQCRCKEGFAGLTCSSTQEQKCPDGFYGDSEAGCRACDCSFEGTEEMGCDKASGSCLCRPGFTGPHCDQCQRGYCSSSAHCEACHPCFQAYDSDIRRLSLRCASLRNSSSWPAQGPASGSFSTRLQEAEGNLQQLRGMLGKSLVTDQSLAQISSTLAAIRQQVQATKPELGFSEETSRLSSSLDVLNRSLALLNTQYQSKKTAFEVSRSSDLSGAFRTISTAYQTSVNASGRITGTSGLLAQAREGQRMTGQLERGIAEHTLKLRRLRDDMAFSPNLTPTLNKMCSTVRAEPCTPGECEGELCPRGNGTACAGGLACRGIFSLSRGAVGAAERAAGELRSFNLRLQETAQLIRAAETAASQIQSNTRRLGDQMSVTRTQIEGDVRRIQQFIKQVRSFLSDPDTNPATIQEVSNYVLSLRLPADTAAILRKMAEIRSLAAKLQCPESILARTAEDVARAKRLQQEAEQARNRANAVEGNVEEVAENLRQARTVLQEAQEMIRGSSYSLQFVQDRLDEIQSVLGPAEKNLRQVTAELDSFTERLGQLRHKAEQNRLRAADARDGAAGASEQAWRAQQGFDQVKQKYAELKRRMGQTSVQGVQGSRIQDISMEANAIFEETLEMMLRMETIETEIQAGNKAFILKSASLAGLEKRVEEIRDSINKQISYYDSC
uniref:Laminin subunit beta 3 n=1 Tax=Crocodylus porosus TaxID=8502 RepID=A0A7M4DUM8_CROPO